MLSEWTVPSGKHPNRAPRNLLELSASRFEKQGPCNRCIWVPTPAWRTSMAIASLNCPGHFTHVSRSFFITILFFFIAVGAASAQTWTQLAPTGGPPSPRGASGAAYDSATNQMIIFAGQDNLGNNLNDVWTLSLGATPQWAQLSPAGSLPAGRIGPSAAYDDANSRLIIFGGGLGHTSPCMNDVWVLSNANSVGGAPTWTQVSPSGTAPAPRWAASAIYDLVPI